MITIILQFFILLAVAAIAHYLIIDKVVTPVMNIFIAMFPTLYDTTVLNLINSILYWLLFFVILSGTYYVIVQTQRSRTPEGYYG